MAMSILSGFPHILCFSSEKRALFVRECLGPKSARFPLLGHFLALFALITSPLIHAADSAQPDYILQPSDLLKIQVFQEDDLQREARISQEYAITLPLIGRVNLRGKSLREAEVMIRDLYDKDYLVNPQVSIAVIEYSKKSVNVLGSVTNPGSVIFPPEQNMNLLDAISKAGGFTRLADRRKITLTRTSEEGKTEKFIINADDIIQGNSKETWILLKDDVIFVSERVL